MKATVALMSILLVLAVGGLGYGYKLYEKQSGVMREVCESRDALAKRAAVLEQEVRTLQDNASRDKMEPTIAAVKAGRQLVAAKATVAAATTSLAKDNAKDEYNKLVESLKGRRVVFGGVVKDVGKRLISFSEMYLTLTVADGYDVKFIFEKESEGTLLALKAGEQIVLEGYVVSTGDLMHGLTVGGPSVMDKAAYDEAVRLSADK